MSPDEEKYFKKIKLEKNLLRFEEKSDQDPCCSLSVTLLVIGLESEQHGS
jgi:hypothetical protein